ncbi:MAG: dephospho-CoA kinase [Kiritimatiellia bacterium]
MYKTVITGGIACGKSVFSRCLSELGAVVLDSDDVVHTLEAPGGDAVKPIAEAFGRIMISEDGSVDRVKLGNAVFNDLQALNRLNGILHPLVDRYIEDWFEKEHAGIPVVEIPLLFEIGWENRYDCVIALLSEKSTQIQRLMKDRGLNREQAEARIAAQMPAYRKATLAHIVVYNNGSVETLRREAFRVYLLLKKRYG